MIDSSKIIKELEDLIGEKLTETNSVKPSEVKEVAKDISKEVVEKEVEDFIKNIDGDDQGYVVEKKKTDDRSVEQFYKDLFGDDEKKEVKEEPKSEIKEEDVDFDSYVKSVEDDEAKERPAQKTIQDIEKQIVNHPLRGVIEGKLNQLFTNFRKGKYAKAAANTSGYKGDWREGLHKNPSMIDTVLEKMKNPDEWVKNSRGLDLSNPQVRQYCEEHFGHDWVKSQDRAKLKHDLGKRNIQIAREAVKHMDMDARYINPKTGKTEKAYSIVGKVAKGELDPSEVFKDKPIVTSNGRRLPQQTINRRAAARDALGEIKLNNEIRSYLGKNNDSDIDVSQLKGLTGLDLRDALDEQITKAGRKSKIGANMIKNIGPKGENNDRGVDTNNETIDGVSEETTRDNTADATTIDNTPDRVDETFENVTPEEVEQAIEENPEGALIHEDITPTDVDTEIEQAVDEGGRNDEVRNDVVETFVEKEPEKAEEFVTKTREEQQEESRKWAEEQKAKHVPVEETNTNPFEGLSDDEREYLNNLTDNIINEYYGPKTKPEPVDIDAFNKQVDEDLEAINNLDNFGSLDEPYSKKEEKERKQREKEYNKAAKEAFEEEVGSTGSKAKHDAKEALEKEVDDAISREEGQRVEQPASPNKSFEQYNAEMDTDAAYDDMIQERDEMRDEEFEDYLRNVPDNLDDLTDFSHPEEEPIDIQEEEKPKKEFTLPKVTLHGGMDTIQSSAPFHDTIDMQEATQTGSTGFSGHGNVSVPSAGSGNVHAGHSRAAPGSNWVPHHDTPIMGTATLPTSNPASPTSHVQPISSSDGIGGTASNVSIPNKNGDFAVNKTGPQGGFTGHTSTPIQVAPIGGGSANKGMLNGMNLRANLIVGIEEKIKSKDPSELEKIGIGHRYKHFDWNGISIDELSGQQLNKLAQLLDEI